jgi:hypothetical protein
LKLNFALSKHSRYAEKDKYNYRETRYKAEKYLKRHCKKKYKQGRRKFINKTSYQLTMIGLQHHRRSMHLQAFALSIETSIHSASTSRLGSTIQQNHQ